MHRSSLWTLVVTLIAVVCGTGCIAEQRFQSPDTGGIWAFAMEESTPAFLETEDGSIFIIEQRILFDFREPTMEELAEMGVVGSNQVPWGSLPFVRRGDIEVQVDYTVSNISDGRVLIAVMANGINEFHEYNPGAQIVNQELVADFSGYERSFSLGPGERRTATIREAEMDEIAVDLSTVVNMAPNPNQIVYFENQSAYDVRSQMYIPDVIAALTGVRLGLRTQAAVPILLEATVRLRDNRVILVQGADDPWIAPQPTLFGPADVAPPPMP